MALSLERAEYGKSGLIVSHQENHSRPRPPLRQDIPRSKGVDLVAALAENGYRYEDAVFKIRAEMDGKFRIGPKLSDWLFSFGDIRKDMKGMKGKGNPDEWEIDVSGRNLWVVTGVAEYKWQAGDIEKEGREKRAMFKNLLERLDDLKIFSELLRRSLPEISIPDHIDILPFDSLNLTFISPDTQTVEFFTRRNIQHTPIPRSIVEAAA
ncbi:MAG TPA: hypothetical protein VFA93_02860 [Patescibacteria group bacterium]|nr:hypothetical protein [Patescibacteria group bacterium]